MPTPRQAIAATAHNRPDRLRQLLDSIARADGAADWPIFLSIEPTERQAEILAVVDAYRGRLDIHRRVNDERLGVRRNPHANVLWALAEGAELVLLLEDDLVLDRQGLRWSELVAAQALRRPEVMCANLLTTTCLSESIHMPAPCEVEALHDVVLRMRFFSSYGLLFTRAQWERHFAPNWFVDEPRMEGWRGQAATGWDVAMNRLLLTSPELCVLQSLVPRVNHDGAGGSHVSDAFQAASFAHVQLDLRPELALQSLRVLDAVADLARIPTANARMYVNLCRHLWTLQESTLAFKHHLPALGDVSVKRWWHLGSYEYTLLRRRVRRERHSAQDPQAR